MKNGRIKSNMTFDELLQYCKSSPSSRELDVNTSMVQPKRHGATVLSHQNAAKVKTVAKTVMYGVGIYCLVHLLFTES